MKPGLMLTAALVCVVPAVATAVATPVIAQAPDGRAMSPSEVRELRRERDRARQGEGRALRQRDQAIAERDRAADEASRHEYLALAAQADLVRAAGILGLPPGTPADVVVETLASWYQQDEENRLRLASLTEALLRIESGEVRTAAEHFLRSAQPAFDDGRLEDADRALADLEFLRDAASAEAMDAWIEAVLLRSSLADQRSEWETARSLAREARLEERAATNRRQWRLTMREADSYQQEDIVRPDDRLLLAAAELLEAEALALTDGPDTPTEWAQTQNELGVVRWRLGWRRNDPNLLERSIEAYEAAATRLPGDDWEMVGALENNIGNARHGLAQLTGEASHAERALQHYEAALLIRTRDRSPLDWAATTSNQANAMLTLARLTPDPRRADSLLADAVHLLEQALEATPSDGDQAMRAKVEANLGRAVVQWGHLLRDPQKLGLGVEILEGVQARFPANAGPAAWASNQTTLAFGLFSLGQLSGDRDQLERSAEAYRSLFERVGDVGQADAAPTDWHRFGLVLVSLGETDPGTERLIEAIEAFDRALMYRTYERSPRDWADSYVYRSVAEILLAEREGRRPEFDAVALDRLRELSLGEAAHLRRVIDLILAEAAAANPAPSSS